MIYECIDLNSALYPKKLREIKNPPQQLYCIGNMKLLNEPSIAVIGSRNCTMYGKRITEKFVKQLARESVCIVSGMAKGIDTIAHNSAIDVFGKTIAVIGSGFNHIYPKENKKIFHRIIQNDGLIISEYEPNVQPESKNFPQRNRIVSGLCLGILVIEAAYRSGTSITANLARSQGRKVMCIPSSIENKKGIGTNELIKKGAILVTNANEILCEFEEFKNKKIVDKNIKPKIDNKEYQTVYKILSNEPKTINELAIELNKTVYEIEYIITMMELDNYVVNLPNKGVILKND